MANIGQPERVWEIVPDEEPIRRQQPAPVETPEEEPEYEPAIPQR